MNGYDSVFANAKDEELEFEVMFDQEDDLIDTIVGCNENGDPLTGAEPCPAATAEERSDDESNPDYEKDIDAADSKDAPKDAEGTVGYDFEDEPEIKGEVDDQTKPEAEPVEGEDKYQEKDNSDKGVEDTVTGTIENDKDVLEAYFTEAEDDLGYKETDTEEERITDAPEVTPDDIEATAKEVAKENDATNAEEVVDNSDKGVEDTVTGTIDNDKDVLEAYFAETEDELSGADTNSATNAKERSCDDCNPDYEKDVDASDTKNAPKDAEGTVGYDFEEKPELAGKVDDQTNVDPKDVKIDEEVDYDITIPKDAEGTVGYDFEVNPEIGSKDDQTDVDSKDVKVEEEVDYDMPDLPPEGTEKTTPAGPTDIETDCGDVAGATNAVVGYDFENEAAEEPEVEKIDKDVEAIEDPENYLDDDAIDDVESGDPKTKLDYDISDEDIIDYAINNK
jgi:hypothetical protein